MPVPATLGDIQEQIKVKIVDDIIDDSLDTIDRCGDALIQ